MRDQVAHSLMTKQERKNRIRLCKEKKDKLKEEIYQLWLKTYEPTIECIESSNQEALFSFGLDVK